MGILDPLGMVSGVGGMLKSFLHPEMGYKKAQEEANRMYQEAKGFQTPYHERGLEAYGPLKDAYGRLLDPVSLQNEWAKAYETSPEALRAMEFAKQQGLEGASSMGLMGSSGALQNLQQGASDIMLQDRRNFLNDLMQKYMQGIGLGKDIYGAGASTAGNLGNQAARQGENMAQLAYNRKNAPGSQLSGILGIGANLLGGLL
jgi:hypothetical protein